MDTDASCRLLAKCSRLRFGFFFVERQSLSRLL